MLIIRHSTDLITKYWKVVVVVVVVLLLFVDFVESVCVAVAVVAPVPLLRYLSRYSAS